MEINIASLGTYASYKVIKLLNTPYFQRMAAVQFHPSRRHWGHQAGRRAKRRNMLNGEPVPEREHPWQMPAFPVL